MKPRIVLDLNGINNSEVVIDAEHYTTCMTGNPLFKGDDIVEVVNSTKTATTNLRTAINAPITEAKNDNVRIARDVLDRCLTRLASKVEDLANDSEISDLVRLDIIHSAGMVEKGQTRRQKNQFTVKNSDISGTVNLTAPGGAKAHEWQYTTDTTNFTGRTAATTTTTARTKITNLKQATKYAFFHKPIVAGAETDWDGPVFQVIT